LVLAVVHSAPRKVRSLANAALAKKHPQCLVGAHVGLERKGGTPTRVTPSFSSAASPLEASAKKKSRAKSQRKKLLRGDRGFGAGAQEESKEEEAQLGESKDDSEEEEEEGEEEGEEVESEVESEVEEDEMLAGESWCEVDDEDGADVIQTISGTILAKTPATSDRSGGGYGDGGGGASSLLVGEEEDDEGGGGGGSQFLLAASGSAAANGGENSSSNNNNNGSSKGISEVAPFPVSEALMLTVDHFDFAASRGEEKRKKMKQISSSAHDHNNGGGGLQLMSQLVDYEPVAAAATTTTKLALLPAAGGWKGEGIDNNKKKKVRKKRQPMQLRLAAATSVLAPVSKHFAECLVCYDLKALDCFAEFCFATFRVTGDRTTVNYMF
jgi:hypothetical protein